MTFSISLIMTLYVVCLSVLLFGAVLGNLPSNRQECAEKSQYLSPCLPFMKEKTVHPAGDCCENVKQIHESNPKCMCIFQKDGTSRNLNGISFNETRLLQLPNVCKIENKLTDCITLLNLSPDYTYAKMFQMGSSPFPPSSPGSSTSDCDYGASPRFGSSGLVVLAALLM